jgi:hypothetical protein
MKQLIRRVTSFEVDIVIFHVSPMSGLRQHTRSFTAEDEAQAYIEQVATAIKYSSDTPASRELASYYVGRYGKAYISSVLDVNGYLIYGWPIET